MEKRRSKSDELKERRKTRGQRARRDDFSWRGGKRLSRLLSMEQRGKTGTRARTQRKGDQRKRERERGKRTKKKKRHKRGG